MHTHSTNMHTYLQHWVRYRLDTCYNFGTKILITSGVTCGLRHRAALRAASWGIQQNILGNIAMEHITIFIYIYKLILEHLVEDIHVHLETN